MNNINKVISYCDEEWLEIKSLIKNFFRQMFNLMFDAFDFFQPWQQKHFT